ncbi:MAG: alanine racemase [Ilumatobacteraceae bacterium]|nr:alanine racemase [Ilumatobacteraceae bacterium]
MNTDNRWAWVEVDLGAIQKNVALLAKQAGKAQLWATVKANGYGHGAVQVAQAALGAGATGLCVALADEAHELRQAKITAPILIVSEQPATQFEQMLRDDVVATLYNESTINSYAKTASDLGIVGKVHLKVDTGMHRVGAPVASAMTRCRQIKSLASLQLDGVYTHFAAADLPNHDETAKQVQRFDNVVAELDQESLRPKYVHTSNSAAAMRVLSATTDIARVGIAIYGIAPSGELESMAKDLQPALSLHARVSHVQHLASGEGVSYGLRTKLSQAATIATLPIGYADGVQRRLWKVGGEVLIGGKRCPIVGVVTMDQLMVNCGDADVQIGDHAILIGAQGSQSISANEIAAKLETIGYEIVCGISARVPRKYLDAKK